MLILHYNYFNVWFGQHVAHCTFEITLLQAIMLTLLLVCSFSPRVHSIQRGPRILLRRNHSSETTKNPTKFVGFLWRRKRDSFLSFAKQPWSAVFMLCKSLRAAAKNDAPCRFLNALVRIPLIKFRKNKTDKHFRLSVWRRKRNSFNSGASEFTHISEAPAPW